jgi:hypothetical protein
VTTFAVTRLTPGSIGDNGIAIRVPLPPGTRLDRFERNPVLLAEHDPSVSLARITDVQATGDTVSFHATFDMSQERAAQIARHVNAGLVRWSEATIDEGGRLVEISLTCQPLGELPDDEPHADEPELVTTSRTDAAPATTYVDSSDCTCTTPHDCTCFRLDRKESDMATRQEMIAQIRLDRADFDAAGRSNDYLAGLLDGIAADDPEAAAKKAFDEGNRTRWQRPITSTTSTPIVRADARDEERRRRANGIVTSPADARRAQKERMGIVDDDDGPSAA